MEIDSDTNMENTFDDDYYYDDYGGDFSLNQGTRGGGSGKKKEKKKDKTKGNAESIYNSKHVRLSIKKTENSKSKRT